MQADGQTRTVLANKVPLRDRSEKIIGILGNYVDITDRKSAEQELLEAKEQAEIANIPMIFPKQSLYVIWSTIFAKTVLV